jgi:hypothetical protein
MLSEDKQKYSLHG